MDTLSSQKKPRASRWSRDAIINDGEPAVAHLTERDIEIFKLLARYRYLPADDIHAFVGGELKPVVRRLNLLSRKPNLYVNRPLQQRQNADANYRRLIYELDERGSRTLRERGLPFLPKSYHRNFAHELMVCRIMASIELGVRADASMRLITWQEILASENTPHATRTSATAASIPVRFAIDEETHTANVTADARPFGIERTIDGKRAYFFFPGIEADRATEPVETSDFERTSIHRKFAAYRAIAAQSLHTSHFGFPNLFVPLITTTTVRMHSMMRMLEKITDGRGSKMFLFKTFPDLTSSEKPPAPGGHMLTEPWQRVGFDSLNFTK